MTPDVVLDTALTLDEAARFVAPFGGVCVEGTLGALHFLFGWVPCVKCFCVSVYLVKHHFD